MNFSEIHLRQKHQFPLAITWKLQFYAEIIKQTTRISLNTI